LTFTGVGLTGAARWLPASSKGTVENGGLALGGPGAGAAGTGLASISLLARRLGLSVELARPGSRLAG
jgi:hypothetical protein